ncbi:MAG: RluA family pseudouridine synthase [Phycisphaeraceae bacterium]|nr:MAG: RluA family pseudouridine synthase [Phycisphaeraceae bacterium]
MATQPPTPPPTQPPTPPATPAPISGELKLILISKRFVVVDKPAGLLSVPGKGEHNQDCVARRAKALVPQASGPFVVHRLDMETSGLMVLARDPDAHRHLSRQFEARAVTKAYEAVLMGEVVGDSGTISLPMRPDIDRRPWQMVDWEHGREAVTRWRVLKREPAHPATDTTPAIGPRTRVHFEPITGRTHQLRVHAAYATAPGGKGGLGCPIVGDTLYGDGFASSPRMLLHAKVLAFIDPENRRPERCESKVPF